jgi:hypothetical protein
MFPKYHRNANVASMFHLDWEHFEQVIDIGKNAW